MPRILVIDDDPAIAELVSVNLEMAGYDVNQAGDGIKGQALAVQLMPDLIMLDLMLPKVDGLTVCQRLRRDRRTAEIPVLMLTALGQTQDKVDGFNAGADDYSQNLLSWMKCWPGCGLFCAVLIAFPRLQSMLKF